MSCNKPAKTYVEQLQIHYAKNSAMPFEQVVQVTKERLEKAFREFSARPNPKPSNESSAAIGTGQGATNATKPKS